MDEAYTKTPNKLLDAILKSRFTASQMIVLLYVIRKTYGWNKHMDSISISKIAKDTEYSRRTMINAVSDLVKLNVLHAEFDGAGQPKLMYVKEPSEWDRPVNSTSHVHSTSHVNSTSQGGVNYSAQGGVKRTSQGGVNSTSHTKEIYKENIKKYKESKKPNRKKGFNDFEQREDNDYDRIEEILSRRPIESEGVSREEFQEQKKEYFTSAIADLLGGKLREENT